jgi:hypothetical protein
MAKLSAEARKRLRAAVFALPGRRFPLNDTTHQREAIPAATRSYHAGNITEQQMEMIKAKARRLLAREHDGRDGG